jgi:thiamine biosynthesis protein ThiC
MTLLNDNGLLREQLGKNSVDVITTTAMTGKNYYAIHFPVQSVITSISASNVIVGVVQRLGDYILQWQRELLYSYK